MYSRVKLGVLEIACTDCVEVSHGADEVCDACNCQHFRKVRVGDGATMSVGSDMYPYTVVEVNKSGKTLTIQQDDFTLVSGDIYSGAEYSYSQNKDAQTEVVRWSDKRNCFKGAGRHGTRVYVEYRNYYYDPCF